MKYNVVVCDPPWNFSDKLTMSDVKRGAESQYSTMTLAQLYDLPVQDITADDAVLALWVVGSQLQEGLDLMKVWGFRQTQTWVWVKTKQAPFKEFVKGLITTFSKNGTKETLEYIKNALTNFDFNTILAFGMGRLMRQTHEICLLGVKGKIYDHLENKSQRSVCFAETVEDIGFNAPMKHSAKPETLQDRLDLMFPGVPKLEMFARRDREGWTCVGKECPSSLGEDIVDSLVRLTKDEISLPVVEENKYIGSSLDSLLEETGELEEVNSEFESKWQDTLTKLAVKLKTELSPTLANDLVAVGVGKNCLNVFVTLNENFDYSKVIPTPHFEGVPVSIIYTGKVMAR